MGKGAEQLAERQALEEGSDRILQRRKVVSSLRLTHEDEARFDTLDSRDPFSSKVSAYEGYPEIQGDMMAEHNEEMARQAEAEESREKARRLVMAQRAQLPLAVILGKEPTPIDIPRGRW